MTNKAEYFVIKSKLGAYYLTERNGMQTELWKAKVFETEKLAAKSLANRYKRIGGFDISAFEIIPIQMSEVDLVKNPKYKKGDFVCFYEGMGEMGYGTILVAANVGRLYSIETFNYGLDIPSYPHTVTKSDMRGLSSREEAMDYYYERNNLPNPNKNKDIET